MTGRPVRELDLGELFCARSLAEKLDISAILRPNTLTNCFMKGS